MRKAWNKIEYKPGEIIGDNGCVYIQDVAPYINPGNRDKARRAMFKCPLCAAEFVARIVYVKKGLATSCGCKQKAIAMGLLKTHGLKAHPMYKKWENIKQRCLNTSAPAYKNYGERGVTICEEWINDPVAFIEYVTALPNYGGPKMTLDRYPNNDGNYEPGNVRWATRHEQAVNKRIGANNTSGYVGVHFNKRRSKWCAAITVNGGCSILGYSYTLEGAVIARDNYIIENELWEYPLQILPDPRT